MEKRTMNRRGDISVVILVLGIVALCFLTVFSFIIFKASFSEKFVGIGLLETLNSVVEEQSFFSDKPQFESHYGNEFFSEVGFGDNVDIKVVGDTASATYNVSSQNLFNSCEGDGFAFFQKCSKTLVRIIYKK